MGRIAVILKKNFLSLPELNNRFTCELCENVHIHYRNFRLEFTKEEFLYIIRLLRGIDIKEVENFKYSDWAYKELIKDFGLPDETFYNDRLQIEQQVEGHFHVHYRNLRLELNKLQALGFPNGFGLYKICKYRLKKKLYKMYMFLIHCIHKPKKFSTLSKLKIKFDSGYMDKVKDSCFYTYKIKRMRLKKLKCTLLTKDGWHTYKITETPEYKFLKGNPQPYIDYCDYKNPRADGEIHTVERFNKLITALETNGYDDDYCIIIDQKNEIIDGKHRACWLLNKYGNTAKIKILKIYF